MKRIGVTASLLLFVILPARGQSKLSAKWEQLTAEDFRTAIQQAQGTCLLPFGILEKHGPHLPLGTDLLNVRYAALHAVEQEYAVVFPEYYFGQIFEAKHQPGTVAYSTHLQLDLLQEHKSPPATLLLAHHNSNAASHSLNDVSQPCSLASAAAPVGQPKSPAASITTPVKTKPRIRSTRTRN